MAVPFNYALLLAFNVFFSVCIAKISLASQAGAPGVVFEAMCLTAAASLGITIFAFTGLKEVEGVKEISFIAPGLSAIGLVFGVAAIFVFAPNDKLGCELDDEGKCKP